jgi:hypothetical protein
VARAAPPGGRLRREIEHHRELAGRRTEEIWGWDTPAGRVRADRRARLFIELMGRAGVTVITTTDASGREARIRISSARGSSLRSPLISTLRPDRRSRASFCAGTRRCFLQERSVRRRTAAPSFIISTSRPRWARCAVSSVRAGGWSSGAQPSQPAGRNHVQGPRAPAALRRLRGRDGLHAAVCQRSLGELGLCPGQRPVLRLPASRDAAPLVAGLASSASGSRPCRAPAIAGSMLIHAQG